MKRYWIALLVVVLAACGGGGQKGNFSDATDRLEVVSWWVSPSEHPAFEVLLNAFKVETPTSRWSTVPSRAAAAATSRLRSQRDCRRVIRPMSGRRSLAVRCAPGSTPTGSSTCPTSTRARLDRTMPQALLDAATYRVKAWGVPTVPSRKRAVVQPD